MASTPSWHSDANVYVAVKNFHNTCTRNPDMKEKKRALNEILSAIEVELRIEGLVPAQIMKEFSKPRQKGYYNAGILNHFERVGSSYDGVKIGRDGFEFDIQVVLNGGNTMTATEIPDRAGYYQIKPTESARNPFSGITGPDGLISPDLARQKFTGRLQRIIDNTPALRSYDIRLVYHGPATEMDIYIEGKKSYSVDMVPCFQIDSKQFVAKPFRDYETATSDNWRISYALDEKRMFNGIDRGNGCRKQVLRVCKAMRLDSPELKIITSYHLKNALFVEHEVRTDQNDWRQEKLALRVLGLWQRMEGYMEWGNMPGYFDHRMNLLEQISPTVIGNLKGRIDRFCRSKDEFMSMIQRIKQQY